MRWSFESSDGRSARAVRAEVMHLLTASAPAACDVHAAELIVGELIANAVRHAPGRVRVELHWEGGTAMLHVHDDGPGFELSEAPQPPEALCESGWGLFLVATAAAGRFVVNRRERGGTHVSVPLPIAPA